MFGLITTALAIHVIPNLMMKAVKKTHKGHEVLTATFAAGVELGRTGKKINFNVIDLATYGFGPESMVEYHLGVKVGKKLASMDMEVQESYLEGFKKEIVMTIDSMSEKERNEVKNTPIMNTLYMYGKNQFSNKVFDMIVNNAVEETQTRNAKVVAINAAVAGVAAVVDLHAMLQPVICFIRKKLGTSAYGKKLLKANFEKGMEGKLLPKYQRGFIDMMVAPSVLDTMRIGNTVNMIALDSELLKEVI